MKKKNTSRMLAVNALTMKFQSYKVFLGNPNTELKEKLSTLKTIRSQNQEWMSTPLIENCLNLALCRSIVLLRKNYACSNITKGPLT